MLTLIIGDASCGKSEYAENIIMKQRNRRIYLATMHPFGKEAKERIRRHRRQREGKGFFTVECPKNLLKFAEEDIKKKEGLFVNSDILLEDIPNLLANEMFDGDSAGCDIDGILDGIGYINEAASSLVIVTGNLFSGGSGYDKGTMEYLKALAGLNRGIALSADAVIEVVCGIPVRYK